MPGCVGTESGRPTPTQNDLASAFGRGRCCGIHAICDWGSLGDAGSWTTFPIHRDLGVEPHGRALDGRRGNSLQLPGGTIEKKDIPAKFKCASAGERDRPCLELESGMLVAAALRETEEETRFCLEVAREGLHAALAGGHFAEYNYPAAPKTPT